MTNTITIRCPSCAVTNRVPAERLTDAPKCGRCHDALFTGQPLALDGQVFDEISRREGIPLLIDFWAAWCAPCRQMAPAFADAARTLEPHVRLGKVDTEASSDLAARFAIRSIPTLILFRGGREVARQPGAMTASDIVRWAKATAGV